MATFYFYETVNTNWATLGNWYTDLAHETAATSLPTSIDDVVIIGLVEEDSGGPRVVHDLLLLADSTAEIYGLTLFVTGLATFENGSIWIDSTLTGDVVLNDYSFTSASTIVGNVTFNNTSLNGSTSTIYGDAVFNDSSSNVGTVNDALIAALTPTFGTPTPTSTGFTVQISNYDADYTWAGTATASGSVAINGTGLVTVTGVAANTSSTAMITTSRAGYVSGVAVVTETSLSASSVPVTFANSYHAYNTSTHSVTGTSTVTASLTGASGTDGVCDSRLWLLIDVTGTLTYAVTANSEAGYDGGRLYKTSSAPAQHDFNASGFAVASIAGLTNVSGAVSGSQTSTGTVAVTAGDYLVLRYTKDSEANDGTNSISATLSII
jgi:hypothetical protein